MYTNVTRLNVATNPELARISLGIVRLRWTSHAMEQASRKGIPAALETIQCPAGSVVELEESYGRVTKYVVRLPLNGNWDKVLVLVPDYDNIYVVVTIWKNEVNDTHKSLRFCRISIDGVRADSKLNNESYRLVYAA